MMSVYLTVSYVFDICISIRSQYVGNRLVVGWCGRWRYGPVL